MTEYKKSGKALYILQRLCSFLGESEQLPDDYLNTLANATGFGHFDDSDEGRTAQYEMETALRRLRQKLIIRHRRRGGKAFNLDNSVKQVMDRTVGYRIHEYPLRNTFLKWWSDHRERNTHVNGDQQDCEDDENDAKKDQFRLSKDEKHAYEKIGKNDDDEWASQNTVVPVLTLDAFKQDTHLKEHQILYRLKKNASFLLQADLQNKTKNAQSNELEVWQKALLSEVIPKSVPIGTANVSYTLEKMKRFREFHQAGISTAFSGPKNSAFKAEYLPCELQPIYEQHRVIQRLHDLDREAKLQHSSLLSNVCVGDSTVRLLDRFQSAYPSWRLQTSSKFHLLERPGFKEMLVGPSDARIQSTFISPFTGRKLLPYIWRNFEAKPAKLRLLEEIQEFYHKRENVDIQPPERHPIDFSYLRPHHVNGVNRLCEQMFWPGIDQSEFLEFPDFSVVALYKKLVIGCGFLIPDSKVNEAYITFFMTHPEWQGSGIGSFMLYHLLQTCVGKDILLHVSAKNTAMLLYQKFGFKPEEYIVGFYDRYYPPDSPICKNAFLMRLRR